MERLGAGSDFKAAPNQDYGSPQERNVSCHRKSDVAQNSVPH